MRKLWKTLTTTATPFGFRSVSLGCLCLLSVMVSPGITEAVDVGDKVIVVAKEGAQLRVVNEAVGNAELGRRLIVEKVNGEWLWVHMEKKGWIKSSDVVAEAEAVEFFTKRIKQDHEACDYFARGKVWKERGETDIAIADFTDAIRQIALNYNAYMRELSRIDGRTSYVDGDADILPEVRELPIYDDDSPEFKALKKEKNLDWKVWATQAYMQRAMAWQKKHEYDNAIHDCDHVLQMAPLAGMWGYRGLLWQSKGNHDKAINDFNEAIRRESSLAVIYLNPRGESFAAKGDHERAISDFTEAIRQNPKGYSGYSDRARSYQHRGEYDKAVTDYEKAVALDPKDPDVFNGLARLLATCPDASYRDGAKAGELAGKAIKVWKDVRLGNPLGYADTMAAAFAETGDFESATKIQQSLVDKAPVERKAEFQSRLNLYLAGKPYRESKPGASTVASDPGLLPEIKTIAPSGSSARSQSSAVIVEEEQDEGVVLRLKSEKPAAVAAPQP